MTIRPADAPLRLVLELTFQGVVTREDLCEPVILIGRKSTGRLVPRVAVVDATVSRDHAVIEWRGKNYWIADRQSLTGTFVDGKQLAKGEWLPIVSGTRLKFGATTADVRLERPLYQEYDVFLCHSHADKEHVRAIAADLRAAGLNPWLDETELAASVGFIQSMSDALRVIGTAAIMWGPGSPGRWQIREIEFLQKANIEQGVRLIPVILFGVTRDPEWPVFIDLLQRVDYRRSHPDPLLQLIEAARQRK